MLRGIALVNGASREMIGMNRAFWATMQARLTHPYLFADI
jgi:hypothetical protein